MQSNYTEQNIEQFKNKNKNRNFKEIELYIILVFKNISLCIMKELNV